MLKLPTLVVPYVAAFSPSMLPFFFVGRCTDVLRN